MDNSRHITAKTMITTTTTIQTGQLIMVSLNLPNCHKRVTCRADARFKKALIKMCFNDQQQGS